MAIGSDYSPATATTGQADIRSLSKQRVASDQAIVIDGEAVLLGVDVIPAQLAMARVKDMFR